MLDKAMVRGLVLAAWRTWAALLILLGLLATHVHAQTLTTLLSFSDSNGAYPEGGVILNGSTLYGTTETGGPNGGGTVFSIATSGGSLTTLCPFNESDGQGSVGGLTLSGSTLYGTTSAGGASGFGTVFSVATSGGSPTTLCTFNNSNGKWPEAGLTLNGATLYGTTESGGASGNGTVFSIATSGGSPVTLCSFNGTTGEQPEAGLTLNGATLYGTTETGEANGGGSVFSIATSGGGPTTLYTFTNSIGQNPVAGLTLSGSTLYGTTPEGGPNYNGTVFSIATSGGSPTALCTNNGSNATLTLHGSTLYGTTLYGGAYDEGTIFSVATSGGSPTTLFSFNLSNGANPMGGLIFNGSTLYGTTEGGGPNNDGTIFALNIAPATIGLSSVSNATIISGGTATVGMTLSNSQTSGYNLNYTLGAAVLGGSAARESGLTPSSGSLAPGGSQSCTVAATATNLGVDKISLTASDPNSSNLSQTTTATLTVLGHAAPSLAVSTGNNQTVIVGATGVTAGLTLSNGTLNESGLASLDVNSLGALVIGATGSKLVPSGSAESYTATLTTNALGTQKEVYSLNVADDHTLPGASGPLNISSTATLTVLGHAAPSLSITSGNNQTVIISASGVTAGLVLSNGTLTQNGLASLDVNSLGGGVTGPTGGKLVASGSSQAYTATLNTGTLGAQTETLSLNVGDDHTLLGALAPTNLSTTATLAVFDHSNASLSPAAAQTSQTINFGSVLLGANVPSQTFTVYNLAANTSAAYTSNLKLTGLSTSGDTALTTNLAAFAGLTANSGSNGNMFTASINTANYTTTGINTITMSGSQLADDSTLPGAGPNNNGALTVKLIGTVGSATADASNSPTTFGAALTAQVASSGSYANLASTVTSTTGSGGGGAEGTTATILAGTNATGSAQTVSMQWRTRSSSDPGFASDILDLSGMSFGGSGQADTFVLQMSYDAFHFGDSEDEAIMAADEQIALDWRNPATGQWENAIDGNFGTNQGTFHLGAWQPGDLTLGDWGVDTANDTVWAVINHNSEFAVVPEPSTAMLFAAAAIAVMGCRWRLFHL